MRSPDTRSYEEAVIFPRDLIAGDYVPMSTPEQLDLFTYSMAEYAHPHRGRYYPAQVALTLNETYPTEPTRYGYKVAPHIGRFLQENYLPPSVMLENRGNTVSNIGVVIVRNMAPYFDSRLLKFLVTGLQNAPKAPSERFYTRVSVKGPRYPTHSSFRVGYTSLTANASPQEIAESLAVRHKSKEFTAITASLAKLTMNDEVARPNAANEAA